MKTSGVQFGQTTRAQRKALAPILKDRSMTAQMPMDSQTYRQLEQLGNTSFDANFRGNAQALAKANGQIADLVGELPSARLLKRAAQIIADGFEFHPDDTVIQALLRAYENLQQQG